MEQPDQHPTGPDEPYRPERESLADYVKRKETDANLEKLAAKLAGKRRQRGVSTPEVSTPEVSTPDLSFEKFEERRRGQ